MISVAFRAESHIADARRHAARLYFSAHLCRVVELLDALPAKKAAICGEVASRIAERGGGLVVYAYHDQYLEHLHRLLNASENTLLATLRGGKHPEYPAGWFFEQDARLSLEDRLRWLTSVRDTKLKTKIRLLLFSDEELQTINADVFLYKDFRRAFLFAILEKRRGRPSPGHLYLADPNTLFEYLRYRDADADAKVAWEDFAIFDSHVVLKHNGATSLTVSISDQISSYRSVFESITARQDLFVPITIEQYGSKTWDEWERDTWSTLKASGPLQQKLLQAQLVASVEELHSKVELRRKAAADRIDKALGKKWRG